MLLWIVWEGSIHFEMGWLGARALMHFELAIRISHCTLPSHFHVLEQLLLTRKLFPTIAKLGAICARLNLLSKPTQIFNVNNTGISVVHKPEKVVTQLVGKMCGQLPQQKGERLTQ